MVYDAMVEKDYEYNESPVWQHRWITNSLATIQIYYYTHTFLENHGNYDSEDPGNGFVLCANRMFFVGGRFLQDHAKRLHHPFFYCGLDAWHVEAMTIRPGDLFYGLKRMASRNISLIYLDNASFGIGWAALGARIRDEVFLVSGSSIPIILRRHEADGQHRLVGDTIVIETMQNEVWQKITPADRVDIEIL